MSANDVLSNIKSTGIAPISPRPRSTRPPPYGRLPRAKHGAFRATARPDARAGQGAGHRLARPGNRLFDKLQRVMSVATGIGLDRSRVGSTMTAIMQGAAGAGAVGSMSLGRMADWWNRLAQSGAPGMRSGQGIVSTASAIDNAAASIESRW